MSLHETLGAILLLTIFTAVFGIIVLEVFTRHNTARILEFPKVVVAYIHRNPRLTTRPRLIQGYFHVPGKPRQKIKFAIKSHLWNFQPGDLLLRVKMIRSESLFAKSRWMVQQWHDS